MPSRSLSKDASTNRCQAGSTVYRTLPATAIADIYGWRFAYNIGADSADAVRAATDTFMDNTARVDVDPGNPVAYALAVQQADTREYVEDKRFYKNGETAASEYAKAQPIAEAAYAELRNAQ